MTFPTRIAVLLSALALAAIAPSAQAARSYDNCTGFITTLPTTIDTQGVWCLKGDLATSIASGAAITVNVNNVTIDCNDFKIGGLSAGSGTQAAGIYAKKLNAIIRHCNVRGFRFGIYTDAGGGNIVEDNRIEGSTFIGLSISGPGSTVRRNFVLDTGGGDFKGSYTAGYGMQVDGGVDVLDNTVAGVVPISGVDGHAYGIQTFSAAGSTVSGNRISGLSPLGDFEVAFGIDDRGGVVEGNYVIGDNGPGYGLRCAVTSTATRNVVRGFPYQSCNDGSVINPN